VLLSFEIRAAQCFLATEPIPAKSATPPNTRNPQGYQDFAPLSHPAGHFLGRRCYNRTF